MGDTTTVEVKTETWKQLNERKEPGDSFDDVISKMLAETE
jgi:predicted CopG family antitoxin